MNRQEDRDRGFVVTDTGITVGRQGSQQVRP